MSLVLYAKHLMIRTPFEGVAKRIQSLCRLPWRLRHPELSEIHDEPDRIDRIMERILRPESNCIDVGCHIGSTLSSILKLAPQGSHMAFEPVPQKAAWLRKKFPEVDVRQVALSDRSGSVEFFIDRSRPGFSGLTRLCETDRFQQITVACDRLDSQIAVQAKVHFLKVDVEGAEFLVLRGAEAILRKDRPVILFESGPGGAERHGCTRRQLFELLVEEHGYEVLLPADFLCDGKPLDFPAFDACHRYPFRAFNYVARFAQ